MSILRRIFSIIVSLLLIEIIAASAVRLLPGDPVENLLNEFGSDLSREVLRKDLHLDQPWYTASLSAIGRVLSGNWELSLYSRQPVQETVLTAWKSTFELALPSAAIALALALSLGTISALNSSSATYKFTSLYGAITAAIPSLWVAPISILVFAVWIPIFEVTGSTLLPALVLGTSFSGTWARLIRERIRESLLQDHARAALARGVPQVRWLLKSGLLPVSGALVSYFLAQLGHIFAGAFVIEVIFNRAGLGTLFIEGILRRDYPVIEAATFASSATCLIFTHLGAQTQKWLDPRLS